MTTANEPTYLRMTHDIDGKLVVEYKISPHGDENPDRGAWFVDTKAEAIEAVASLKLAADLHPEAI